MGVWSDLKILWHMSVSPIRGKTHSERLESFYSKQAQGYDDFRRRLLKGRQELCDLLPLQPGQTLIDMGGGTGANLEFLGAKLAPLKQAYLLDLSGSLLKVAGQRIQARGWTNVTTVEADATAWLPPEPVDAVTFSYSLTMIPDWFAAMDQAEKMLRPGGLIGIVDFYVARKYPETGRARHSWSTRTFWPTWFGMDNVFPSPDHVPYLHRLFEPIHFSEHRARLPYLPFSRAPYYLFLGKKRTSAESISTLNR